MYIQLPLQTQWSSIFAGFMFFGLLSFSNMLNAQCTLSIESVAHTDAACGQSNGTAEVVVNGGTAPLNFAWSNAATTQQISGLAPGVYTVTVTDAAACSQVGTVAVSHIGGPNIDATTITADTCVNTIDIGAINLTLSGNAPYNISWAGPSSGSQSAVSSPVNIGSLASGIYNVSITDAAGCMTVRVITVTSTGGLAQTNAQTQPTCAGGTNGSITITPTVGSVPFDYYINGTFSATVFGPHTINGLSGGIYVSTVIDQSGCTVMDTIILDEAGSSTLSASTFTVTDVTCPGGNDGVIDDGGNCPTCQVFEINASTAIGNTPVNTLTAGFYEIQLSNGGCTSYLPVVVDAPAQWSFYANTNNPNCVAGNVDIMVSGATPAYSFLWSNAATTEDLTGVAAGTYAVTVTDAQACQTVQNNIVVPFCSSVDTIMVTMYAGALSTACVDTSDLPGNYTSISDLNCTVPSFGSVSNINTVTACVDFTGNNFAGMDTVCIAVCDDLGFCDTTIIIYHLIPSPDTAIIIVPAGTGVIDTCPINLQLSGTLAFVQDLNCDVVNEGGISVNPTNGCVSYTPPTSQQNAGTRSDTICVRLCDTNGDCDTMIYIFHNLEPNCTNLLPNTPIVQQLTDCSNISACITTIPRDSAQSGDYTFTINGLPYAGTLDPCNEVARIQYPFVLIPSCTGNYIVTWTANGVIYGPDTVSSVTGILNFMNFNDGNTAWTLNANNSVAAGNNTNGNTAYGDLVVTCTGSGSVTNIGPTIQPQYAQGTELGFATQGTYNIVVTGPLNCRDTQLVVIYCANTEEVHDTIEVGTAVTFCLDISQVPSADTVINFCASASTGAVSFIIDQASACVTYVGDSIGSDIGCFIVCSTTGACDTTYMFIDVALPRPIAVDDTLDIVIGETSGSIDVCLNDIYNSQNFNVVVLTQPSQGSVIADTCNITYSYNSGFCGQDQFQYLIFNPWGGDTATVFVNIPCDSLIAYDGFSPNSDGINDFFVIQGIQGIVGNEVTVYNRWGSRVFRARDYQNDWDGTFNGRDLPDGDYYITIVNGSGVVKSQKWIRIQR